MAGSRGTEESSRRFVALEVGRFALAGVIALVIVGLATAIASRRVGEREAIADARTTTVTKAQGLVAPALTDGVLTGSPSAIAAVDTVVRRDVLDRSLVRVKLWNDTGTIVYSDEPRLVGADYALGADEQAALVSGRIDAEVSDLAKPENRYERSQGKLLEVYLPVETPSGKRLLFEAYYQYGLVSSNGSQLWRSFAPIALGALLALELVQIPAAYSLARRLRQRSAERELLLRQSLEASDVERRHIASDLHDGVVQDLAGVAYALSAQTRGSTPAGLDADVIESSASTVRASIRALRSLVVDIYPPDFGEVTLDSALTDLLARAAEQGVDAELAHEGIQDPIPDPVARILYRVAQEGVRNVLSHAGARHVTLTVATVGPSAVLDLVDDGRGFDAAALATARDSGHLGITALRGLVTDAGGLVTVSSEPGARYDPARGDSAVTIRVVVADDHAVVRGGLEQLLSTAADIELVGTAADGREAAEVVGREQPDVVLMDLSMPEVDGVEATRRIVAADPDARVVVLTSFADDRHISDALQAGAIGYVLKHAEPDELLGAIRAAARGDAPLDPKAARVLLNSRKVRSDQQLSAREEEVLRLVMAGLANKQIARRLGIAERTVKAHLTNIFARIEVTDRTQAALWAERNLPPEA